MSQPQKILFLTWGRVPGFVSIPSISAHIEVVDQYELIRQWPTDCAGLIISMHADQRHLSGLNALLTGFLDADGTLLFNGHMAYPIFPELDRFQPLANKSLADLRLSLLAKHPVYEGIDVPALGIRRGVAGFYGRGYNPPPKGARPLVGLGKDQHPVDWVWERPAGGRIFMHAGNDLWGVAETPEISDRLMTNMISWITADENVVQ